MSGLVLPEHRPTLGDLVAPRWRVPLAVLVAVALAALAGWRLAGGASPGALVVHRGEPAFSLRRGSELDEVRPRGAELLHLERRAGGALVAAFTVEPLALPPYAGNVSGMLPLYAERELAAIRARHPDFELVQEGKARVNSVAGYTMIFRAPRKPLLYGRLTLLPEPVPGARRGFRLLAYSTPAGGAGSARAVGAVGATELPYQSFRFGTEAP